jgi:hypothetical protein
MFPPCDLCRVPCGTIEYTKPALPVDLRRTSARHIPSAVTVTFRRDITGNWHAELFFAGLDHYLPWNDALAEEWLAALFLQDRPGVREVTEGDPQPNTVRHFELVVAGRTCRQPDTPV